MSINTDILSDLEEIDRFEQAITTFNAGGIDADRFTAVRLQQGVYGQRQQGVNMLRIKIPGGRLTVKQLEAVADVAENYSQRQIAHVTTRQAIQVHFIPLDKMPDAMRRLAKVGMTTREACGNTVRNMSACALSGVCPREHVDVATHLDDATQHFLRNSLNQQMPRKMKMSFSACESDCAQSMLHDIGVIATVRDGKNGFMVKAGGGLGHKPREAIVVEEFISERELMFSLEALVTLHNKYSDRVKRAKSRIKFLVEKFGVEGFLEKYREEFNRTSDALADQPYAKGEWRAPTDSEVPGPGAPRKVFAQRQQGLFVLPIALPIGDATPQQLHGMAVLLRETGLDELHTTQDQNLVITNVPESKLEILRGGLAVLGLSEPKCGDDVVACPGTSTCRLGITASTVMGPKLSGGSSDLRIRVSGCHNGCAQPETGDIGIYGEGKRKHGKLVPHYQMYFAGNGSHDGALAIKGPSLPVARIEKAIARVQQAHLESGEKSFFAWARSQEADYFKQLLADLAEINAEDLDSVMRDYGDTTDFKVLNLGGGECAGATQVMIGANFFEAAHEREYRNALVFQRKYMDAVQCNESILRLIGGGLSQLLGGNRDDDLAVVAEQLSQLAPSEIADEFVRVTGLLNVAGDSGNDELTTISSAVDGWTVNVAKFATEKDSQLDLTEAADGLLV
ncbi:MAG: nitrite/sulfite reductase [Gallionella sp.]